MIALILFIFYLGLMFWSFGRLPLFRNSGISKLGLSLLFIIKLVFSITLVLVYTYYYTDKGYADIYKFFNDGNVIYKSIYTHPRVAMKVITGIGYEHEDPEIKSLVAPTQHFDKKEGGYLESNHHLIIRVNVLLRFLSYGSIYIHSLLFCFFSFIGLVALYRALSQFFRANTNRILIIPLFFIPSILFWSSGLLKETLVIFFLGMLFFTALKVVEMKNILINLILSALCLHFLYLSKPFIALSFLISFYVMGTFYFKGYTRIISVLVATLGIMWFFYSHDTFVCEILSSLVNKRNEFVELGLQMKANSLVDSQIRSTDCLTPLGLIPSGLYNLFMQPFIWSHGLFEKLFGLENLFLLLFTVIVLYYFKRPHGAKLQLTAFCFVFFMSNYILIGITVPIIGALVRYKIFGLLFYLIMLLCFINVEKIILLINSTPFLNLSYSKVKKLIFS